MELSIFLESSVWTLQINHDLELLAVELQYKACILSRESDSKGLVFRYLILVNSSGGSLTSL